MHACQFPPLPPFGGVSSSMARHMTCCSDTHLASASSEQAHLHKASAAGGRQGNKRVSKEPAGVEWLPAPSSACPAATHAGYCRCACRNTGSLHATHVTTGSHMTRRSPNEAQAVRHGLEADAQCVASCLPGGLDGCVHGQELGCGQPRIGVQLPELGDDHLRGRGSGGAVPSGHQVLGSALLAAQSRASASRPCRYHDANKAEPAQCPPPSPLRSLAPGAPCVSRGTPPAPAGAAAPPQWAPAPSRPSRCAGC